METEFRDYSIVPGRLDDFLAGWRIGVMPLREEAGFRLLGAWVDREHDRLIWVLGYEGADGFDAADERYHAMPARIQLEPEPSELIEVARRVRVDPVT